MTIYDDSGTQIAMLSPTKTIVMLYISSNLKFDVKSRECSGLTGLFSVTILPHIRTSPRLKGTRNELLDPEKSLGKTEFEQCFLPHSFRVF